MKIKKSGTIVVALSVLVAMMIGGVFIFENAKKLPEVVLQQPGHAASRGKAKLVDRFSEQLEKEVFAKSVTIYEKVYQGATAEQTKKWLETFGMKDYQKHVEGSDARYSAGNKVLTVRDFTCFSFDMESQGEYKKLDMDDAQVIQLGMDYLKAQGVWSEEFSNAKVGFAENNGMVYQKTAYFYRMLEGYKVVGNSMLGVSYTKSGIDEVISAYHACKPNRKVTLISKEKAMVLAMQPDSVFVCEKELDGMVVEIILDHAEIVYVEHSYDGKEKYIQPCYRLFGVAKDDTGIETKCEIIVRAVPDEFTK